MASFDRYIPPKPPHAIWVAEAKETDLIFGRGGYFLKQPRFRFFRKLVLQRIERYREAAISSDKKSRIAEEIIDFALSKGTRFYQFQPDKRYATPITRDRLIAKIRQIYMDIFKREHLRSNKYNSVTPVPHPVLTLPATPTAQAPPPTTTPPLAPPARHIIPCASGEETLSKIQTAFLNTHESLHRLETGQLTILQQSLELYNRFKAAREQLMRLASQPYLLQLLQGIPDHMLVDTITQIIDNNNVQSTESSLNPQYGASPAFINTQQQNDAGPPMGNFIFPGQYPSGSMNSTATTTIPKIQPLMFGHTMPYVFAPSPQTTNRVMRQANTISTPISSQSPDAHPVMADLTLDQAAPKVTLNSPIIPDVDDATKNLHHQSLPKPPSVTSSVPEDAIHIKTLADDQKTLAWEPDRNDINTRFQEPEQNPALEVLFTNHVGEDFDGDKASPRDCTVAIDRMKSIHDILARATSVLDAASPDAKIEQSSSSSVLANELLARALDEVLGRM